MVWTFSYPLPIDYTNSIKKFTKITFEPIGSTLYIFANIGYQQGDRLDIFVFDTKTRDLQCVSYERPTNFGCSLDRIDTDGKDIYLWREGARNEKMLFKFDVTTRSMTYILTESRLIYNACPIIGDNMFVLAMNYGSLMLLTIDLSKKQVVRETSLGRFGINTYYSLDTIGDELYMYRSFTTTTDRVVYKVVSEGLIRLSHDHFTEESEIFTNWRGGCITYKRVRGRTFYRDTFDFKALKWNREELSDNIWICSDMTLGLDYQEVDGVRYSLTKRLNSKYPEYGLRLFDNKPSLSTTCYLNIVEEVVQNDNYEGLEIVKKRLPLSMSYELDELIGWRKWEKDIIAAENAALFGVGSTLLMH